MNILSQFFRYEGTKRLFFMTTICAYLTLSGGFISQVSAASHPRIALKMKSPTLSDVIWELQKQTNFVFVYNTSDIEKVNVPAISVTDANLKEVLNHCFRDITSLAYEIVNDVVIIKHIVPAPQQSERKKRVLEGKVTDEKGRPIVGATVSVRGTPFGAITDASGSYHIQLPSTGNMVITYSFIGFETVLFNYTGQSVHHVTLKETANQMNEIVVTGYQKIERRVLTSSIATVDLGRLERVNQPNLDKLLQGQVAGMTIMNSSGAPGSVPQIRIRGTSTINGSVQPLWVVDGMILDDPINAKLSDILANRDLISSGIGGININDIESINVLKDAAATALYGTRAANGVIVITTRNGQVGKPQVRYGSSIYLSERPRIKDAYMMNSKERIDVNMEMIERGAFSTPSPTAGDYATATDFERYFLDYVDRKISLSTFEQKTKELETVNTDWFKHLFRHGLAHRHNIDISGGTETMTYFVSGSYMDDQSIAKGVGQKTYTGNVKTVIHLLSNLQLEAKINVSVRDSHSFFASDSWSNPYDWAINANPAHRAYDENGNFNYMYSNSMKFNFMENNSRQWRESGNFAFTGNAALNWDILKYLRLRSSFSIMKQNTTDADVATEESYYVRSLKKSFNSSKESIWSDGGWRKDRSTNATSITLTNQLSYMPIINHDHRIDMIFGNEIKTSKNVGISTEVFGYAHGQGQQMIPQWDMTKAAGRAYWQQQTHRPNSVSFYGVMGYTLMNRYTATFNWRADGANGFGSKTNNTFNPVWALGLNYQMKEEGFLKHADWLTYLTLRGSYGIQGNLPFDSYSDVVASYGISDGVKPDIGLNITSPKNPGLKWEKTNTLNLALEFGLFGRRISVSTEYYKKDITDVLGKRSVSDVTGFSSLYVNWASMKNKGWEFTLNTINIDAPQFKWTTNFNIAHNENEVKDVRSTPLWNSLTNNNRSSYSSAAKVGYPINALWSFRYAGLNEVGRAQFYTQNYDPASTDNEVVTTGMEDMGGLVYSGNLSPPTQGGLTNTFTYKNVSLQVLFTGSFGHVVRLRNLGTSSSGYGFPNALYNMPKEWANRWRKAGDETHTDIPVLETDIWDSAIHYPYPSNSTMYDRSDLRTVKGDYVRLQNLSLSYDLHSKGLKKIGIRNMRFMIQGSNLHVWHSSKLKGQDPEASGQARTYNNLVNPSAKEKLSFNNTYLPLARSYSFTLSILL